MVASTDFIVGYIIGSAIFFAVGPQLHNRLSAWWKTRYRRWKRRAYNRNIVE